MESPISEEREAMEGSSISQLIPPKRDEERRYPSLSWRVAVKVAFSPNPWVMEAD